MFFIFPSNYNWMQYIFKYEFDVVFYRDNQTKLYFDCNLDEGFNSVSLPNEVETKEPSFTLDKGMILEGRILGEKEMNWIFQEKHIKILEMNSSFLDDEELGETNDFYIKVLLSNEVKDSFIQYFVVDQIPELRIKNMFIKKST